MPPLLVTAAIIQREQSILITRRPAGSRQAGFWEFPGGKLEEGESPEQCLEREILEELGVQSKVGSIFETVFYRYAWGDILLLAYHCHLLEGAIRNLGVAEHRWVLPEHLDQFELLPADAPLVRKLHHVSSTSRLSTPTERQKP